MNDFDYKPGQLTESVRFWRAMVVFLIADLAAIVAVLVLVKSGGIL